MQPKTMQSKTMQLTYRGVAYDYQPAPVDTVETGVTGKYRGLEWRFRNLEKPPVQKPTLDLVYRGVHYSTGTQSNNPGQGNTPVQETVNTTPSVRQKACALFWQNQRSNLRRQQVMFNRAAQEIGLTAQLV
ncbi:DUF4278 domain-containing protein [Spirulina subsalsa FACHB-351]|uniref:DUF4278 domain-containing protein n=1 Tax=Spirulina subsalsa FACHB-351 TaxID=234711 RepID=A0ABT3L432_9CYAN|nr:DUF4278 domain-containing protein [Spirulina subsalsa]MCW6036262.1 DUF4278 domain-containing protein [Spirulina subsalsa FACHB-351]